MTLKANGNQKVTTKAEKRQQNEYIILMEAKMSDWEHLLGIKNSKGVVLTEAMLQAYEATSMRNLECIFCGTLYPEGTKYCSRCKDYKGMQPCIEGWSEGSE